VDIERKTHQVGRAQALYVCCAVCVCVCGRQCHVQQTNKATNKQILIEQCNYYHYIITIILYYH